MIRLIFLLAAVGLIVWAIRSLRRPSAPPPPAEPPREVTGEEMVACVRCGVHLPRGESFSGRGGMFCSEQHRLEYDKSDPGP